MHVFLSLPLFRLCLVPFVAATVETGLWKYFCAVEANPSALWGISHKGLSNFFLFRNNIYLRSLNRSCAASFTIDWFEVIRELLQFNLYF